MTWRTVDIRAEHSLSAEQVDAIEERLYAFNAGRSGHEDAAPLAFLASADGELIGAVAGFTWGGICELRQAWVDDASRGAGLGRALVRKAIAEARGRGCSAVFLTTYDFQAPGFYAGLGFETLAAIPGKPQGHTEFVMRLRLGPPHPDMPPPAVEPEVVSPVHLDPPQSMRPAMSLSKMIGLHPDVNGEVNELLVTAARHSMLCSLFCTSCADACVAEQMDMRSCIRACMDCADVCAAAARLAVRRSSQDIEMLQAQIEACIRACEICASECERHEHAHCKLCATMCRECADDCRKALPTIQ